MLQMYTFALSGRGYICLLFTQGVASLAPGYVLTGLSARQAKKLNVARQAKKLNVARQARVSSAGRAGESRAQAVCAA